MFVRNLYSFVNWYDRLGLVNKVYVFIVKVMGNVHKN